LAQPNQIDRGTKLPDADAKELMRCYTSAPSPSASASDAQVSNRALDFRVAEQDLHGLKVTRLLIEDRRLGSAP
jgi:hypothetical protein